jgi:hypothetical protein
MSWFTIMAPSILPSSSLTGAVKLRIVLVFPSNASISRSSFSIVTPFLIVWARAQSSGAISSFEGRRRALKTP